MDSKTYKYQILISDKVKTITLKELPQLNIKYISAKNELCGSAFGEGMMCFWEGSVEVELEVNGLTITVNDHDSRNGIISRIVGDPTYEIQGLRSIVIDQDRNKTYIVIQIKVLKYEKKKKDNNEPELKTQYKVGETFTINLPSNPSTGYSWKTTTSSGLKIVSSDYDSDCTVGLTGCGGKQNLVLRGTKKGVQTLSAIYSRDWEKKIVEPEIYEFHIV